MHAFSCTPTSVTFFGTLEIFYNFFSGSTRRWGILTTVVGVAVKRLSDTRWSAQQAAVKPVMNNFGKLIDAVEKLCDESENLDTRGSAQIIMANVCDFTFLAFLRLWTDILEEINHTQRYLQIKGISLDKASNKLRELELFIKENRESLVSDALDFASQKCEEMGIDIKKRGRKRSKKMMPGEKAKDEGLSLQE